MKLRNIPISEAQAQRLRECQDVASLQRRLARAAETQDAVTLLTDT